MRDVADKVLPDGLKLAQAGLILEDEERAAGEDTTERGGNQLEGAGLWPEVNVNDLRPVFGAGFLPGFDNLVMAEGLNEGFAEGTGFGGIEQFFGGAVEQGNLADGIHHDDAARHLLEDGGEFFAPGVQFGDLALEAGGHLVDGAGQFADLIAGGGGFGLVGSGDAAGGLGKLTQGVCHAHGNIRGEGDDRHSGC